MKRAMVYLLALTLAFSTMLAGCGEMRGTDTNQPTETPAVTDLPEMSMPDPDDGEVRDRDGIITDGDSGAADGSKAAMPKNTAKPAGTDKLTTGNAAQDAAARTTH